MRSQMEANKSTLPGLSLPVTAELTQSIEKFKKGFINYVQVGTFSFFIICIFSPLFY